MITVNCKVNIEKNGNINFSYSTEKDTMVRIIDSQQFGKVCLMDGVVQSATSDEKIYHGFLANLGLASRPKKVLIVGSGEGCLARDVLAADYVESVWMVDWDKDVIRIFSQTDWVVDAWAGKTTWADPRLRI